MRTFAMDVICVSSDSENSSNQLDETITYSKPLNIEDDIFVVDWNDDYYPPVIESIESPKTNAVSSPKSPIQIERKHSSPEPNHKLSTSRYDISESSSTDNDDIGSSIQASGRNNLPDDALPTSPDWKKPRMKQSKTEKACPKALKEKKKLERDKLREEKKAEHQKQKALKAVFAENQRNLKPEENIKFLKVHIDTEIINSLAGGNLIVLLQQNNIQYAVESNAKNNTIFWTKRRTIKELDEYGNIKETLECRDEEELVYIVDWFTCVKLVHSNELLSHLEEIKSVYLHKKITLVIYGLQKYFDFIKNKKKNDGKPKKYTETESAYNDAPRITQDQLEFALTELQIFGKHNVRLVESPEELSALIYNMTKSLSQLDYKLDKQKRQEEDFDWFAKGDSGHAVKVDKNGEGLLKLWQQQICQFSAVGLETAQAVVSQHKSPLSLVTKYENCNSVDEGELLLQNLQIRRDLGLLSSTRRIGPQLSKKIYKFFTSDDPDEEL